jgi:drug/metabolite transporter (DMT)-like permease
MNIPKGFGFLSSTLGALLLLQVWNFEFKGKTMGNALIVGSTICSAVNSLIQKQILNEGHHPLVIQFYVCCVGMKKKKKKKKRRNRRIRAKENRE